MGRELLPVSPMSGGVLQPEAAQQCGYRMPSPSYRDKCTNSGVWLAAADPDATATAPGVARDAEVSNEAAGRSQVKSNALLLGKVFAARFSGCTQAPSDAGDLVNNASQ